MAITPINSDSINSPSAITPESGSSVDTPVVIAPETSGDIDNPTVIAPETSGGLDAPVIVTPESGGDINAPVVIAPESTGGISAPVTLSSSAQPAVNTPSSITAIAQPAINRTLSPLFNFNAALGLPDTVTFSRSSSASYIETYIDSLNRKQKRISTVLANIPRYEEKGLLVEGASTNLILHSEEFDNVAYGQTRVLVEGNAALSPDKSLSAEKLNATATTGDHFVTQNVSATNPTISIYAKAGSLSFLQIVAIGGSTFRAYFNLSNGTIGTTLLIDNANIEDVGSGWFRCSVSVTDSITSVRFYLNEADNISSFTGVVTDNIFIWGAQVESLPFATSYIRTEESVVSRSAENISQTINVEGERTLFAEYSVFGPREASNQNVLSLENDEDGDFWLIADRDSNVRTFVRGEIDFTSDILATSTVRHAASLANNSGKTFVNWILLDTDTSANYQPSNQLYLGKAGAGSNFLFGHIKRAEIYDLALTANEVKAL